MSRVQSCGIAKGVGVRLVWGLGLSWAGLWRSWDRLGVSWAVLGALLGWVGLSGSFCVGKGVGASRVHSCGIAKGVGASRAQSCRIAKGVGVRLVWGLGLSGAGL